MVLSTEFGQVKIPTTPSEIAKFSLRTHCYTPGGPTASEQDGHYGRTWWVRDIANSMQWALETGEPEDVKQVEIALDRFLCESPFISFRHTQYKHSWEYIGVKIHNGYGYDGKIPPGKQFFNQEAMKGEYPYVADTFLILKLAGDYIVSPRVTHSDRVSFWNKHKEHLQAFYQEFTRQPGPFMSPDGLVDEAPLSSRVDCLLKSGTVFHTNVYWYMTLMSYASSAQSMQDLKLARELYTRADQVKRVINTDFWLEKEGHFIDWIDRYGDADDHFDSLAHCEAIVSGLVDRERSVKIIDYMLSHNVYQKDSRLVASVDRKYDKKLFSWEMQAADCTEWFNNAEDGNVAYWPEMAIMFAAALKKSGFNEMAAIVLGSVEDLLIEHGTLHETYDKNRQPIDKKLTILKFIHFHYRSPAAFAMALGKYLKVKYELEPLKD